MEVFELTEDDIQAVHRLESLCFPDPWSQKGLRDTLRESSSCFLGVRENDTLCGYLNATWVLDEININRICTHPAFRRRGVATVLITKLKDFCRLRGIDSMFLEVRESNASARAFYTRMGFEEIGCRPNFYENPAEDAVLMARSSHQ